MTKWSEKRQGEAWMDEEFILKEHQYQQRVQYKSVRHVCHRNRVYGKSVLCK